MTEYVQGEKIDFTKIKTQERNKGDFLILEIIYKGVVLHTKKVKNIFPDNLDIWADIPKIENININLNHNYESTRTVKGGNKQLRFF